MSDEKREASEAWRDVVNELDALGDAISRWAKAAVNDPENKRRLDELSARLDSFVASVNDKAKSLSESEVGEAFRHASEATGEAFRTAGEKITEKAGTGVSTALKTVSEKLRSAAEHIEDKSVPNDTPAEKEETAEERTAPEEPPSKE